MLLLTRKTGTSIVIGDNPPITVKVQEIRDGKCRLAISAPREVLILRSELLGRPPPEKP